MKKLLLASLLLFSTFTSAFAQILGVGNHHVYAPPSIKAIVACDNSGSGVATISCTYANVPAGAVLAVGVAGATAATGVSDSSNGALTKIGNTLTFSTNSYYGTLWYLKNASAGFHTVTASFAGATNFTRLQVVVLSNASNTDPLDSFSAGQGVGTAISGTATTSNFTTTHNNEMIVAFVWGSGGSVPVSASSPYTYTAGSTTSSFGVMYGLRGWAGSYTASASINPAGSWGIMAMAVKQ